jgi:hypothetical protein
MRSDSAGGDPLDEVGEIKPTPRKAAKCANFAIEPQRGEITPQKRAHSAETFARIPHDKALELGRHRISGAAWLVLIELDRIILKRRGQNPVRLNSSRLKEVGIHDRTRQRALRQLAAAGVIKIKYRDRGLAPLVAHLWYPLRD